uniref:Ig-like domain-containing protein n=1 Tax=Chrysemys picta bellii TaxID=8478 RepID=A0A8C3IRV5_CHRPI
TYAPHTFLCSECSLGSQGVLSRILGDSVTFPLGIPAEQVTAATWTVNTTRSIVTVAAGNPPTVIVLDPSYEGRLRVPESNSLQITSLRMEDTGTYSAQIRTATGIIHRPFPLRVYSKLPEPTVLCDSVTCVNETCNYNLSCRVRDGGEHVTYSWTHTAGGAVVPNESIHHISQSPRDAHLAVTCTAQNPASNSSTTASAKDLCAGNSLCRIALPSAHRGELASGLGGGEVLGPSVWREMWWRIGPAQWRPLTPVSKHSPTWGAQPRAHTNPLTQSSLLSPHGCSNAWFFPGFPDLSQGCPAVPAPSEALPSSVASGSLGTGAHFQLHLVNAQGRPAPASGR